MPHHLCDGGSVIMSKGEDEHYMTLTRLSSWGVQVIGILARLTVNVAMRRTISSESRRWHAAESV